MTRKSVDLATLAGWTSLSDGNYNITIVAKADGYRDSAKSTSVTVTKGGATLINFTIDGTSYQAEDGMTWSQWVNSSYNTGGFYIRDLTTYVYFPNGSYVSTEGFAGDTVGKSETIITNGTYYTFSSGGGGN